MFVYSIAAIVQYHQMQQSQDQKQQQEPNSSSDVGNNEANQTSDSGDADYDADDKPGDNDDDNTGDEQPIDMSSHPKLMDENRAPTSRQGMSSGSSQQNCGGSNSSPVDMNQQPSNNLVTFSDMLSRVANRLPTSSNMTQTSVPPVSMASTMMDGGQSGVNELSAVYAKFQSAIASAVSTSGLNGLNKGNDFNSATASPYATLAQQLLQSNGTTSGLLSPAIAGLVQKAAANAVQQQQSVPPTEPLRLNSLMHQSANVNPSNRRQTLPPFVHMSKPNNQPPTISSPMVSPNPNSNTCPMQSSGGVRTADRYRVVYTSSQTFELEQEYRQNKFITITKKKELARQLGLNERQVKIWFQNRRAKDKRANRRGAESATGEDMDSSMSKKPKTEPGCQESFLDHATASSGSSTRLNHQDANSNSGASYDGSLHGQRGVHDDMDSDDDERDGGDEASESQTQEDGPNYATPSMLQQHYSNMSTTQQQLRNGHHLQPMLVGKSNLDL